MTITSPDSIRQMLRNKGAYPGDPPASRIYQYESAFDGKIQFAVFMSPEHDDMSLSPAVASYLLLMENGKLTIAGRAFLEAKTDER